MGLAGNEAPASWSRASGKSTSTPVLVWPQLDLEPALAELATAVGALESTPKVAKEAEGVRCAGQPEHGVQGVTHQAAARPVAVGHRAMHHPRTVVRRLWTTRTAVVEPEALEASSARSGAGEAEIASAQAEPRADQLPWSRRCRFPMLRRKPGSGPSGTTSSATSTSRCGNVA